MDDAPLRVDLDDDERLTLIIGLNDWGGPAHPTDAIATLLRYDGVSEMLHDLTRLKETIEGGGPLSRRDWTRALVATEIVFVSDVFGTGREWVVIQGTPDEYWIGLIRRLQEKVPAHRRELEPGA